MTYREIYKEFCDKFPNADVEGYRPANPKYIPQLLSGIPNAIVLWLMDGSVVVYISYQD